MDDREPSEPELLQLRESTDEDSSPIVSYHDNHLTLNCISYANLLLPLLCSCIIEDTIQYDTQNVCSLKVR